ncbi:outer membrane receptor for ferrienterochelin and colicins [Dysgonomonas sp. PH5-45]|uniref:TonB-dependent receptor n=1 Tax=unclassified Dysgonomonas TaxID=2630389 RepID=UPI0024755DB4|nr:MULTISPECIES: TonB-dependent receptor [unclassified Dysgonomonas]MDH6354204.1 outer membrane receptor for ferrienterochelin and colicins [Dysgonomonas sp. PH5-45]MDH6387105.1 outer membrane receptor for ferrienterochelin and colicins [Dysgonomonas sp. PH5-37]
MKKYILILSVLVCSVFHIQAEPINIKKTDAHIMGHVKDKKTKEHLAFITVSIKGTTIGTTTDATGHYFLKNLPEGKFIVEARFIGYGTQQQEVVTKKGETLEVNFELEESVVSLDEVVVSANRNATSRRIAPTLVNVLDAKTLDYTNSCTLSQGLNFQPGLRVESDCQNCGLPQVRMNGLEGAYTQILIDSRPIFSALAGVYGLDQIPANMIERVEVVRGGGSALFGSSAIAGTINVITKEPTRNTGQISHTIRAIDGTDNFENSTTFNASLVSDNQKMGLMVFGQNRKRSAYDNNGDGFTELPKLENRTLGFRSYLKTSTYSKLSFEYHNMHEFRRGGDRLNQEPFNTYITEQAESSVNGGGVNYSLFSSNEKHHLDVYSSFQLTNRKSYYGAGQPVNLLENISDNLEDMKLRLNAYGRTKGLTYILGSQYVYKLDKLLFMPSDLTAGIEYNRDELEDESGYRDNPVDQKIHIESIFAQNEWKSDMWSFLIGARVDKHSLMDDAIFSPRANIRYNPTKNINLRASYGRGFRAPQIFDEDLHVDLASGQRIVRKHDPDLKEETSDSFSASADWYLYLHDTQLNFLVEGFYTHLRDPFTPRNEEQPDGSTIKWIENGPGAKVYGVNLEARAAWRNLLQLQAGVTIQQSRYNEAIKWSGDDVDDVKATRKMMRTPDMYGFFVATLMPFSHFNTSLSGNYTGRMYVPYEGGGQSNHTVKSDSFFELHWRAAYEFDLYKGTALEISGGVQNIFNSYQKDFDKGKDRVSSYIYGPSMPRNYFLAAKLSF